MKENEKARKVALYGILIALAMVLSFVETLIPIPIPVPGVKLGLANLVTVAGLYLVGIRFFELFWSAFLSATHTACCTDLPAVF